MSRQIDITEVRLRMRDPDTAGRPLIGWASCVINGSILLNNIEIRRAPDGRPHLVFPARLSRRGNEHPYFCPTDSETRAVIEQAVLRHLPTEVNHG